MWFTLPLFAFLPERNESIIEARRIKTRFFQFDKDPWTRRHYYVNSALAQKEDRNISFPTTGNLSFLRIESENEDDKFDSKFMD